MNGTTYRAFSLWRLLGRIFFAQEIVRVAKTGRGATSMPGGLLNGFVTYE